MNSLRIEGKLRCFMDNEQAKVSFVEREVTTRPDGADGRADTLSVEFKVHTEGSVASSVTIQVETDNTDLHESPEAFEKKVDIAIGRFLTEIRELVTGAVF